MNETSFENKVAILSDLWIEQRTDPGLEDFIQYNDLGLPLAYAIHNKLVVPNGKATDVVAETFGMLLDLFDCSDEGWDSLDAFWDSINDAGLNN